MKTSAELLKPRFEIISDYPNNTLKVGTVINQTGKLFNIKHKDYVSALATLEYMEQFPHIFRKMNWWENRKKQEMPKKLKAVGFDDVYEIEEWDMDHMIGFIDIEKRECCDLRLFNPEYGYFPVD